MTESRNYGIDLLRMLCMLMVPILHVLGHGGVLEATAPLSPTYWVVWLLEAAAICAVDCFGLISGYVGYGGHHRARGLVKLCLQATFYSVAVTLIFAVVVPGSVGPKDVVKSIAPWAFELYWYLSAYFCLFFFMRYLDVMVASLDDRGTMRLLGVMLVVLSVLPTAMINYDFTGMHGGYCFAWLAVLYVTGACLRRVEGRMACTRRMCLAAYGGGVLAAWGFKLVAESLTSAILGEPRYGWVLLDYTSPAVVCSAVGLVLLFSRVRVGGLFARVFGFCAPLCFGVYLLHEEPLVREYLIAAKFAGYADLGPVGAVLAVLGTAAAIFVVGILVDAVRARIFALARVDAVCDWVGGRLDRLLVGDAAEKE